jgi:uncharacterized membrane protein
MQRNTLDLFRQIKKDTFSISILLAFVGVLLGIGTVWHHINTIDNADIDYRELLSVTIGVLTTIVVTTYSLTIVALQLASVQFSPRILRWFLTEDRFNQVVLGSFIGEISYLILLKSWSPKNLDPPLVIGLAFAILLVCVVFPLFIAHIADSINAGGIIRRIAFNLLDEIDKMFGKEQKVADSNCKANQFSLPDSHFKIYASQNGYVESVDYRQFDVLFLLIQKLLKRYKIEAIALHQIVLIGEFVGEQQALFAIAFEGSIENLWQLEQDISQHQAVQQQLNQTIRTAKFRSYRQDINFGIRQLVDIAIKAISPAVNDPTTCINVLDYLGVVLRRLVQCPAHSLQVCRLPSHIHAREFGFREFLDHAFDQIYHFGKEDFVVVLKVLRTLRSVIEVTTNEYYLSILKAELNDIAQDLIKSEANFTSEGFKKIKKEIDLCNK